MMNKRNKVIFNKNIKTVLCSWIFNKINQNLISNLKTMLQFQWLKVKFYAIFNLIFWKIKIKFGKVAMMTKNHNQKQKKQSKKKILKIVFYKSKR